MIFRAMTIVGALAGGVGGSQFPEFSQQYVQRLGGAVDELARQVQRYEMDAAKVGLSLDELLTQLAAEGRLSATQAQNMAQDIARHDRLSEALAALQQAGPFSRVRLAPYLMDGEIVQRTRGEYKMAMPLTFEGAVFTGTGLLAGWAGVAVVLALLGGLWGMIRGGRKAF